MAERPQTSLTLLQRLRANEPDAWSRVVSLYRPLVCYWCGRQGVIGADADDVAQEVFQVASARLADFRRERPGDTFRGWLRGITRIKAWEHRRDAGQFPPAVGGSTALQRMHGVADDSPADSDAAPQEDPPAEISALLRRALDYVRVEFEPATWRAFLLTAVDGKSAPDAAAEIGLSAAAVRQAKSRVLRRVRQELGDLPD
jgi:RNA polymerase sigma-70 factor (ECF subfamily)